MPSGEQGSNTPAPARDPYLEFTDPEKEKAIIDMYMKKFKIVLRDNIAVQYRAFLKQMELKLSPEYQTNVRSVEIILMSMFGNHPLFKSDGNELENTTSNT